MAWLWLSMLADAGLVGARLVTDAVLSPGESWRDVAPWLAVGTMLVATVASVGLWKLARADAARLAGVASIALGTVWVHVLGLGGALLAYRLVPYGAGTHPGYWVDLGNILVGHLHGLAALAVIHRAAPSDDDLILDVAKALLVALVAGSLVLALAWHLYELADDTTWLLSRWVPMIRAALSYAVLGMFLGVTGVAGWRLRRAVDAD